MFVYLRVCDWGQLLVLQLLNGFLVFSQVQFSANKNDGGTRTMMSHLRIPLHTMLKTFLKAGNGASFGKR